MPASKKLNDRQKLFVQEYLVDLNATQAASRAGYEHPNKQGPRLLVNVGIQDAIAEARKSLSDKYEVTPEKVIRELALCGFSNLDDFVDRGEVLPSFDFSNLSRDQMAAVSEITVDTRRESGEDGNTIDKVKFKLHPKLQALDKLVKHLGLEKPQEFVVTDDRENLTPEDMARRIAFMLRSGQEEPA